MTRCLVLLLATLLLSSCRRSGAEAIVHELARVLFGAYPQTIARRGDSQHAGAPGSYGTNFGLAHAVIAWRNGEAEMPTHLVRTFRDSGFRTAGFPENPLASNSLVLGDGFEHFVENKDLLSSTASEEDVRVGDVGGADLPPDHFDVAVLDDTIVAFAERP